MADKAISELIAAEQITATDMFVLEQNGTAKKLTGQVLLNWLTAAAHGHGGIQSITKLKTDVLADTYRITLADTTIFDFVVTNGRGVVSISKIETSGLADTYRISYNDGSSGTFTVTNGEKGDKGDNAYIWIKFASQEPTASSSSFGDIPDNWIGVYFGTASTAPTDWQQYKWFKIKGEKGDTGAPATLVSSQVTYQVGSSGTIVPSGSWSSSIPSVAQGKYLWTKQVLQFNTGSAITSYSVARSGIDGTGAVSSVAGVSPDETGNVPLSASAVGALPIRGGTMDGSINMNGQKLTGLNPPTADDEAATKKFVETYVAENGGNDDLKPKAGFIYPLASAVVPEGFLLCDGAEYARTEYPELFAAIGTMYGEGDRSTTFNVPDLATRVPIGSGENYNLGDVGGEETHTLTIDEMPEHNHRSVINGGGGNIYYVRGDQNVWVESQDFSTDYPGYSGYAGSSEPHNNMQPYTVVNYIIATGKDTGVSVQNIVLGAQAIPLGIEYGGTGATNAEDARKNLGLNDTYNHIDNSDFTQFVAQAGVGGKHGTQAYAGDRWILDSGTVTGNANGNGNGYSNIQLTGTIRQIIANPPAVGSVFVETVSGTVTATYQNGEVTITSNGGVLRNVLLCEGAYIAANKPKYQPKGYGAELVECKRYFRKNNGRFLVIPNRTTLCELDVYADMRILPSVNIVAGKQMTVDVLGVGSRTITVKAVWPGKEQFTIDTIESLDAGHVIRFDYEVSADL